MSWVNHNCICKYTRFKYSEAESAVDANDANWKLEYYTVAFIKEN